MTARILKFPMERVKRRSWDLDANTGVVEFPHPIESVAALENIIYAVERSEIWSSFIEDFVRPDPPKGAA